MAINGTGYNPYAAYTNFGNAEAPTPNYSQYQLPEKKKGAGVGTWLTIGTVVALVADWTINKGKASKGLWSKLKGIFSKNADNIPGKTFTEATDFGKGLLDKQNKITNKRIDRAIKAAQAKAPGGVIDDTAKEAIKKAETEKVAKLFEKYHTPEGVDKVIAKHQTKVDKLNKLHSTTTDSAKLDEINQLIKKHNTEIENLKNYKTTLSPKPAVTQQTQRAAGEAAEGTAKPAGGAAEGAGKGGAKGTPAPEVKKATYKVVTDDSNADIAKLQKEIETIKKEGTQHGKLTDDAKKEIEKINGYIAKKQKTLNELNNPQITTINNDVNSNNPFILPAGAENLHISV